jgi:hypothetical protein
MNFRILAAAAVAAAAFAATAAKAEIIPQTQPAVEDAADDAAQTTDGATDRLLIVNGNNGRVVYDDGRDDLFCVTRRVIVGYNEYGYPIRKRTMHCR